MGGDGDRTGAPVAARGSAPRGAGDRESHILVAAVTDASDAPQRGDREICKLPIFSASFIHLLSWEELLGFDLWCILIAVVEMHPPRPGQGASLGGGDLQPEPGCGGEEARCA
jgi:hypothetical protein